jgi:uncharacterized protein
MPACLQAYYVFWFYFLTSQKYNIYIIMFKNKFFIGFIALAVVFVLFYSLRDKQTFEEKALAKIEKYKSDLVNMEESPIKENSTTGFTFFDPNEKWIIDADFVPNEAKETFNMQMTDKSVAETKLVGTAKFNLNGKNVELLIFDEESTYLLPFTDETNGTETYGGGRYINISKDAVSGNKIEIDFNQAHNFYCAYNENYICPIPPVKNSVPVKVEAGEKNYHL